MKDILRRLRFASKYEQFSIKKRNVLEYQFYFFPIEKKQQRSWFRPNIDLNIFLQKS